ncbi:MAG: molybdenum cofactor guanylyltransferase [Defluviitaleaceae bacterium]|nr:molybdenum cofactor guanylyltransferase [Defluviitaleaceae bacterium]
MKNFGDAFILCGGKSRRMGFDKSLLKIKGEYVINIMAKKLAEIFDNVVLCANASDKFNNFNIKIIEDIYSDGIGPVAAIHAALNAATTQYIFIIAVDMPLINLDHIRYMMSKIDNTKNPFDAMIPLCGKHKEALYGFYNVDALPKFVGEIEAGNYAMHKILAKLDTIYLDENESRAFDADLSMFANLNYATDLSILENFGGNANDK